MPLSLAIVYASRICESAFIVAFTKLCGLEDPLDCAITSVTQALSRTARIAPPAFIPVPVAAGLSNTKAPPKRVSIS